MSEREKIYPEFRKGGIRFQLYSNGEIHARTRDIEARRIATLVKSLDDDTPRIPSHKSFNGVCKEMIRKGDLDDLVSAQKHISEERGRKRNAGVELYEALTYAVQQVPELASVPGIKSALEKADGK